MPSVTGHMNYFNITECGLYRYQQPNPFGCDSRETFKLITDWLATRTTLEDTLPWAPDARSGSAKCYCQDFYHDEVTGDYLLVLWKSDTDSAGTIWGAQVNAAVGQGKVVKYSDSYRGSRVIWGRPCYYWVIPALETVVSIKFDFSLCDSALFQDWVTACINNRVNHANKRRETLESGAIRLHFTDGSREAEQGYRYAFDVKLKTVSTSTTHLRDLAAKTTHVLKRETVMLGQPRNERADWVRLLGNIPYMPGRPKSITRNIEIKAEAKPSVSEIREIIERFATANRKRTDWENVGFVTDTGIFWADKYRLKDYIEVDHDLTSGGLTAASLYAAIEIDREDFLAPVRSADRRKARAA